MSEKICNSMDVDTKGRYGLIVGAEISNDYALENFKDGTWKGFSIAGTAQI